MKKRTRWRREGGLELYDLGVAFNIYGNDVLWESTCGPRYRHMPLALSGRLGSDVVDNLPVVSYTHFFYKKLDSRLSAQVS